MGVYVCAFFVLPVTKKFTYYQRYNILFLCIYLKEEKRIRNRRCFPFCVDLTEESKKEFSDFFRTYSSFTNIYWHTSIICALYAGLMHILLFNAAIANFPSICYVLLFFFSSFFSCWFNLKLSSVIFYRKWHVRTCIYVCILCYKHKHVYIIYT